MEKAPNKGRQVLDLLKKKELGELSEADKEALSEIEKRGEELNRAAHASRKPFPGVVRADAEAAEKEHRGRLGEDY